MPEIELINLIENILDSQSQGFTASPIKTLDGTPVNEYLTIFAAQDSIGGLEAHADWNNLMTSAAQDIQAGFTVWSGEAAFYPGDNLTIALENGTVTVKDWLAIYYGGSDTGPLETGGDFYNFFVIGLYPAPYYEISTDSSDTDDDGSSFPTPDNSTATPTEENSPAQSSWFNAAYPNLTDMAQNELGRFGGGVVSGYFLHDTLTAVLS